MTGETGSSVPQRPLRVGVLVDSFDQPRWIASILQGIQSGSYAELVVTISNAAVPPVTGFRRRLSRKWRTLLFSWYSAWDIARNSSAEDALEECDVESILRAAPVLDVVPRMTVHTDRFEDDDIDRIRGFDLDVILRFGFRLLRGSILDSARYGVWSYHHGDNSIYRGGPPCFWEVAEGNHVTGSILQVITEELDGGQVLYRSFGSTNLLSVHKTRQECFGTAQQFVLRKLRDVSEHGADGLVTHFNVQRSWEPYSSRLYVAPTNRQMLGFSVRMLRRYLAAKWRAAFWRDRWMLAYHIAPAGRLVEATEMAAPRSQVFHRFKLVTPPNGRMWADPFPLQVDGRFYVLFEDWPVQGGKGHIALIEWQEDGQWSPAQVALERPYHLSYPYVFEWNGEHYLVPESVANRTVELYRAISFPTDWTLERILLHEVPAVDPTVLMVDGRWWMFVSVVSPGGSPSTELHVYHADTPLGPWTPHSLNPVKSDVRNSRPAGRLFEVDGTLYRPAQDCSVRYGHAMALNRIDRLSETEYSETPVARIDPRWRRGLVGTHTINVRERLTVIDGLFKLSRYGRWRREKAHPRR